MKIICRKKIFIWSILAAILVVGLILAIYFSYRDQSTKSQNGAVVANGIECANIGTSILKMDGSAIDAAIATLFCEGVTCPQSMGLGGGFLATVYTKSLHKVESLIARETAPLASNETMFVNKTTEDLESQPGLNVAVPGELKGYWHLHKKYGVLPWKTLIQPTIDLCRKGHLVTKYLAAVLKPREQRILNIPSLKEIFINPDTQKVWNEGDRIKRPKLAETLEKIAEHGDNVIYGGGEIGKLLVQDIKKFGGIITMNDFMQYEVKWTNPISVQLHNGHKLYSSPLPGSGSVLGFILNVIDDFLHEDPIITWHRIIESFKHAYGLRTRLGDIDFVPGLKKLVSNMTDPEFAHEIRKLIFDDRTKSDYEYYGANFTNNEDHGTANIAVLAPNGDAIVITSTINNILGSMIRSSQTGIILNDEMDDFSTPGKYNSFGIPPSPANYIQPRKRPMSSMCPSIILDKNGDARLLIGSAGGSKITTSVALVIIRHLIFGETLNNAVQNKRVHHQLAPMMVQYETGFNETILRGLEKIGHRLKNVPIESGFSSVTAIANFINNDNVQPVYDSRRSGSVSITRKFVQY